MKTNEEWIGLVGLKGRSDALAEAVQVLDEFRTSSGNLWIQGELEVVDRLANFVLRDEVAKKPVPVIHCERGDGDLEYFIWEVFGAETPTPGRGYQPWTGALGMDLAPSCVRVDGVHYLSKPCLDFLSDVITKREFQRWGGTEKIPLNCRWIITEYGNASREVPMESWAWFAKRLNPLLIEVPGLHERADDIAAVVDSVCDEYRNNVGLEKNFSRRSLLKLRRYSWPGGVIELENVLRDAIQSSGYKSRIEPWDVHLRPSFKENRR